MKKILLVDDDSMVRSSLSQYLRARGYHVEDVSTGSEAIEKSASEKFDVVLLDMLLPDSHGIDVLKEILKSRPKAKVIMVTGFASIESAVASIKKGATYYLSKPFELDQLDLLIRQAFEESRVDLNPPNSDLDYILSCLSNPIRRDIIRLLHQGKAMGLMQITRDLHITDHTKVSFHLRLLKESGLIRKHPKRTYYLTKDGMNTFDVLQIFERSFS
jgi:DNA-binding response OmpR family regulator